MFLPFSVEMQGRLPPLRWIKFIITQWHKKIQRQRFGKETQKEAGQK
jgi:hypothetical protein